MKRLFSLMISIVLILSCGVNVYGAKYNIGDKIPNFEYITVDSEIKAPSPDVVYKSITVSAPIVDGKELYKYENFVVDNGNNYISGGIEGYRVVSPKTEIVVSMDNSAYIENKLGATSHVGIRLVPFRKNSKGVYTSKVDRNGEFTEYYYTIGDKRKVIHPRDGEILDYVWVNDGKDVIREATNLFKLKPNSSKSFTLPSYSYVKTGQNKASWVEFSDDIIWAMIVENEYGCFRQVTNSETLEINGVFTNIDPNEENYHNRCLFIDFFKIDEDYIEEELGVTSFIDVKKGDYFAEAVKWGVNNNIVNGTSDNEFSPNDICTHAHILTFLWRVNGSKDIGKLMPGLTGNEWYAKAASWAYQNHLIINTNILSQPCDRLYVVKYLIELKKGKKPSLSECRNSEVSNFIDLDDTQKPLVLWAIRNGITSGVSDTEFAPNMSCTRGQIITFLYRAYEKPLELTEVSYSEDDVKYLIGALYGTGFEVDSKTELACMAWLILNRVDNGSFGDSIKDVVLSDDNFNYDADYPSINACGINLENIARGVLSIWESEKASEYASGRVLPPDYIWFDNNIDSFSFRNDFQRNLIWNYSLPSPYEN